LNINTLINNVLKHENSFVDYPPDKSSPTNFGITLAALDDYTGKKNCREDLKALSKEEARLIYEKIYYLKPKLDELPEALQPLIFDMAVNQGLKTAIKLLQYQLLDDRYLFKHPDGFIGPVTIAAANKALFRSGNKFINKLVDRRIEHYRNIVNFNPGKQVFLNGWIARAETFRVEDAA